MFCLLASRKSPRLPARYLFDEPSFGVLVRQNDLIPTGNETIVSTLRVSRSER